MAKKKNAQDWLFFTVRLPGNLAPKVKELHDAEAKRDPLRKSSASAALARFLVERLQENYER